MARADRGDRGRRDRRPTTSPSASTRTSPCSTAAPTAGSAHECILDIRPITKATGVTVDDVAKRLMDYGFHAPTMSFPVAGTLMVEPTESERLARARPVLRRHDRDRRRDRTGAVGRMADRATARCATLRTPQRICSASGIGRTAASVGAFPVASLRVSKYFPPVSRIDGAYGDRNLVCSCEPLEAYATSMA